MFKEKICSICGKSYVPTGGCSKTCSLACQDVLKKTYNIKYHLAHYKQKGAYKWEMPKGTESPFYKNGIGIFVKIAFDNLPHKCHRCGSTDYLCVHHKDRNRKHNEVSNLEILCKSCHQKEHLKRDKLGRFTATKE